MAYQNSKKPRGQDPNDNGGLEKTFERSLDRLSEKFGKLLDGEKPATDTPPERFFIAVRRNRLKDVETFLKNGIQPDSKNDDGDTALHICARKNFSALAEMLLKFNANPKLARAEDGRTPLDEAVHFNHLEMVKLLAQNGGYVSRQTADGWTLLHHAAEKGRGKIVRLLLEAGAEANVRTGNGSTALMIAIQRKETGTALALLDFKEVVHGMNRFYAESDPQKRTAFQLAVGRGDRQVVARMLALGADINGKNPVTGETALYHALEQGDFNMVQMLVENGADLNAEVKHGVMPLYVAVSETPAAHQAQIVEYLIRSGADPEARSGKTEKSCPETAMHYIARTPEKYPLLDIFLKYRTCPDIASAQGETPLITAVKSRADHIIVQTLLNADADPSLRDAAGKTALDYACQSNDSLSADMLERALEKIKIHRPGLQKKQEGPRP